jgi:hypothetical protein
MKKRRKAWAWFVITLFTMLIFAGAALWLLGLTAEQATTERAPQPEAVVLTDHPGTEVDYIINYYTSSDTRAGITTFGSQTQATPINTREITFNFHGRVPGAKLNWVILVNSDAVMTQAISDQARGKVQVTQPGQSLSSTCPSLNGFPTAQVLSGLATLDQDGNASASVVGGVSPEVHYPRMGERTAVNVISVLPASPKDPSGNDCAVTLNGWDQVNGELWRTPHLTSGTITVGEVPGGSFVESANPPVGDPRRLSWQLQGPADVSYTLFDTTQQGRHERRLFYAGAAAALAATLLVETAKAALELGQGRKGVAGAPNAASSSHHAAAQPTAGSREGHIRAVSVGAFMIVGSLVVRRLLRPRP